MRHLKIALKIALMMMALLASGSSFASGAEAAEGHGAPTHEGAAHEGAEGGHEEGVPWGPIGFHALNLAILLGIAWKFALPAVRDSVANRAAGIRRDIETTTTQQKAAEARYAELNGRLAGFEAELARMKAEAEVEAQREREQILVRAERDATQVREATERAVRAEVARARYELRQEAARLAVQIATEQIGANLKTEDEERFATEFLSSVKGVHHGG